MTNPNEIELFNGNPAVGSAVRPPRLLVSVRDLAEFRIVWEASIDIIDLKEPQRGPLAPVDPELWRAVADRRGSVDQNRPKDRLGPNRLGPDDFSATGVSATGVSAIPRLSAALGERAEALAIADEVPGAFSFAKVGASGCETAAALIATWGQVRDRLPGSVELVGVAYADHLQAGCLPPEEVFAAAKGFGLGRVLIDTFVKDGTSTRQHLGTDRLRTLCRQAKRENLWWALAGSIRGRDVDELRDEGIEPDCFGVRGGVCRGDRTSRLDSACLAEWQKRFGAPVTR